MKFTGFIKEHDNIKEAIPIKDIQIGGNYDRNLLPKILNYLDDGILIFSWMGYVNDIETQKLIVPHGYYSDGVWIWPSYLPYYINKYSSFRLDPDFLKHLSVNNFKVVNKGNIVANTSSIVKDLVNKLKDKS